MSEHIVVTVTMPDGRKKRKRYRNKEQQPKAKLPEDRKKTA